jgi:hypothetical protein
MVKRGSALGLAFILALAATRLNGPSSPAAEGASGQQPGMHYESQGKIPAPGRAQPHFSGTCTAYFPQPKSHGIPYDENLGAATKVIETFFGAEIPSPETKTSPRYAIVLAPDPRHTNLGFIFDREMSLVLQAAQDEGYDYNSSWLPWRKQDPQSLSQLGDQQYKTELEEEREACPGILLFRKRPDPTDSSQTPQGSYDSSLVVFVVGEQATGGMNQEQWSNAIAWLAYYASSNLATDHNANDGVLRVLGPTFTGSLVSLERGLTNAYTASAKLKERFPDARILSGSVSGCSGIHWFESHLPLPANGHHYYFGAFQENDDLHIYRLLDYLKREGTQPRDIAILSEDETAYAAGARKDDPPPPLNDPCLFPYARDNRPVNLVYPRDISALRNAYQEQSVFDSSGARLKQQQRSILRESTGQAAPPDDVNDTVPSFGGAVAALDQESYLYGLVDYLRTHHSRYLVLRCTNPLDFLFLTRFFHRAYPDARIVTVGSDLLFRREIDTTEFRGVLSLSSYSLLPQEQHWTTITQDSWGRLGHNHLIFQGHLAEGMYIAMRYLLQDNMHADSRGAISPLISDQKPQSVDPIQLQRVIPTADYEGPFWLRSGPLDDRFVHRPPTWISVIGRDGYWPVAVLDKPLLHLDYADEKKKVLDSLIEPPKSTMVKLAEPKSPIRHHYEFQAGDPAKNPPSFGPWMLMKLPLSWFVTASVALALVCYQLCGLAAGGFDPSDGLLSAFRITCGPSHKQSFLLGISCALAIAPLFELTTFYTLTTNFDLFSGDPWAHRAQVVTAFLFVVMILLLLFRYRNDSFGHGVIAAVVYLVICFLFACGYWIAFHWRLTPENEAPMFYRMAYVTDGVSPLLPILLLTVGFYLWNWQAMAGNLMLAEGCPTLPKLVPPPGTLDHSGYRISREFGNEILMTASPVYYKSPRMIIVLLFFFVVAVVCFAPKERLPLLSLESIFFSYGMNSLLLLALVFTMAESIRLYSTWIGLKDLLQTLGRLPLRRTIARLRPIGAGSIWSVSGNVRRVQYDLFSEQLGAANRFNHLTPFAKSSMDQVKLYGEKFKDEESPKVRGRWDLAVQPPGQPERQLRDLLSDAVAEVFKYLDGKWENETESLNLESGPIKSADGESDSARIPLSDDPTVRAAEEFIGYHYIAFIQNVAARIRTITLTMIFLFVAICFAISSYPFVPRTGIGIWLILNLVLIGSAVAYVYAGMERDEILSAIAHTQPGRLGAEFWLKLAGFLVGPVIGILTTQFPSIADSVLGWLQPGLDALR